MLQYVEDVQESFGVDEQLVAARMKCGGTTGGRQTLERV